MRHKYTTSGVVLARTPLAEAGVLVTVLTSELGLVRARAEGLRRSGAKLAHALQTLDESDLTFVRGKEGWRVTGAVLAENRFAALPRAARVRAARVAGLLLQLVHGESSDAALYQIFSGFIETLAEDRDGEEQDAAELLTVLRILALLGLDAGALPPEGYGADALLYAGEARKDLVARVNRGIQASGL